MKVQRFDDAALASLLATGARVVEQAKSRGATVAEASVRTGSELSAQVRLGKPELLTEAVSRSVGLRVICSQRVAVTYTNDLTDAGLQRLVDDALQLAALSEVDPFAGPPPLEELADARRLADLQLYDTEVAAITADECLQRATLAEAAALRFDRRLTQSEGATFARIVGASALVTSGGFQGVQRGTYASLAVRPVAEDQDDKKRAGAYWTAQRHLRSLEDATFVGEEAARRTLAKLGARKVATQQVPVVFDPDAGRGILALFASCVQGGALWRRTSYLQGRLGSRVASAQVHIVDDPTLLGAPGSRSFDGEGLAARRNVVVDAGMLQSYLLDSYSGRKLSMLSTGSAARGASGGVGTSVSNLILCAGEQTAEDIVGAVEQGLYVTETMGFGFNAVTGDFSRGAAGFWIEKGKRTFAVSEITISLNLDDLLQQIDAVGDDLQLRSSIAAPTFRVRSMAVAGT